MEKIDLKDRYNCSTACPEYLPWTTNSRRPNIGKIKLLVLVALMMLEAEGAEVYQDEIYTEKSTKSFGSTDVKIRHGNHPRLSESGSLIVPLVAHTHDDHHESHSTHGGKALNLLMPFQISRTFKPRRLTVPSFNKMTCIILTFISDSKASPWKSSFLSVPL